MTVGHGFRQWPLADSARDSEAAASESSTMTEAGSVSAAPDSVMIRVPTPGSDRAMMVAVTLCHRRRSSGRGPVRSLNPSR